jgi:predicted 3-demethylubiquinone-9 3-methyltransferase (glyoxalase superfamily)
MTNPRITPCLWFDNQAEEAAQFYIGIFPNSKITGITRYGEAGQEIHGQKPGTVMVADFELAGQPFVAINGGPIFKFNEAISLQVPCDTKEELEHYWAKLSKGGDPQAQQCGWLKDKYGVSWQVTPNSLARMLKDPNAAKVKRVTESMLQMKKLDIDELERVYRG